MYLQNQTKSYCSTLLTESNNSMKFEVLVYFFIANMHIIYQVPEKQMRWRMKMKRETYCTPRFGVRQHQRIHHVSQSSSQYTLLNHKERNLKRDGEKKEMGLVRLVRLIDWFYLFRPTLRSSSKTPLIQFALPFMMHGYFKMSNVSCHIVSDTSLFIC